MDRDEEDFILKLLDDMDRILLERPPYVTTSTVIVWRRWLQEALPEPTQYLSIPALF